MRGYLIITLLIYSFVGQARQYELPFKTVKGLMLVEASIAGSSGYYIFDSGSNSVIIHRRAAVQATTASTTFQTIAGPLSAKYVSNGTVQIGDYQKGVDETYLADLTYLKNVLSTDLDVKGILGGHVFTPHAITIDRRASTITIDTELIEEPAGLSTLCLSTELGFPSASVRIGTRTYRFIVDSGAKSHHVSPEVLIENSTHYQYTDAITKIFASNGQEQLARTVTIDDMTLGNNPASRFQAVISDFSDVSAEMGVQIDGILSVHALQKDILVIDLDRKRLYF